MFEIGKKYDIKMLTYDTGEPAETLYPSRTVIDVDGHLIKIDELGSERIINTSSSHFISAKQTSE